MRPLRVLGIAEGGSHLVCEDASDDGGAPETFTVPLDERLRAAVRGDVTRLGQLEIEMEPQLRPREIQSRIRAGATLEQVAAAAGCPADRVERYAYPVLMERATMAERAQQVRPLRGAAMGTAAAEQADDTLEEIVSARLADRGQLNDLRWDAFRDERGWTVTATWRAGRSENRADWSYRANADGGVVAPRNDEAADLLEPAARPLRTVDGGGQQPRPTAAVDAVGTYILGDAPAESEEDTDASVDETPAVEVVAERQADTGTDGRSTSARSAKRGHRPPMPSWEDVLLGTRSAGK